MIIFVTMFTVFGLLTLTIFAILSLVVPYYVCYYWWCRLYVQSFYLYIISKENRKVLLNIVFISVM